MLLTHLLEIADRRLPFADQVAHLRQQRQWLIDLDRLLDPARPPLQPLTSHTMADSVCTYLTQLLRQVSTAADSVDQQVAQHIHKTFRDRWWGLFTCYDVEQLPRTNNELEQYMRRMKMGQRRISGRKNVHEFILRYGRFAACLDYQETVEQLLARLHQVSQEDFLRERRTLDMTLLPEQKRHRFRYHQDEYLRELEARWADALDQTAS